MNPEVNRRKQRLDSLFAKADEIEDLQLLAHWARYLCVLCSGFIEMSVRTILGTYASNRSNAQVARFAHQRLSFFQNPRMGKICAWIGEFNQDWGKELKAKTDGALQEAVNSIVANRHSIAHGSDVPISVAWIREYYERAVEVIELLEEQMA